MEVRWTTADPDALAAWLAPLRLGDGQIVVEPTVHDRMPDRLTIVDLAGTRVPDGAFGIAAVGLATVDWERYALNAGWSLEPAAGDEQLGGFAWVVPGQPIVLLEPSTEGRLAAALARVGEGPVALYLRPTRGTLDAARATLRAHGVSLSSLGQGPLGPQVLVLGRPAAGPHVLLVDAPATIAG